MPSLFCLSIYCSIWKLRLVPPKWVPVPRNFENILLLHLQDVKMSEHWASFLYGYDGNPGQCHLDASMGSTERPYSVFCKHLLAFTWQLSSWLKTVLILVFFILGRRPSRTHSDIVDSLRPQMYPSSQYPSWNVTPTVGHDIPGGWPVWGGDSHWSCSVCYIQVWSSIYLRRSLWNFYKDICGRAMVS